MIAAAHAEKEHIQAQIKEARRASQRAEAALRLEIETVKKATEKAGSMDLRAKQKALALQEQVKQAWAAAEHADGQALEVENTHGDLEKRLASIRVAVEDVRGEWKVIKEKEDKVRENDKKQRAEEEKKLTDITGKIDRLRSKKEKKAAEKVDLEKKLHELVKQAGEIEQRNEEEASARRGDAAAGAYWWDQYHSQQQQTSLQQQQQPQQRDQQQQHAQLGIAPNVSLDKRTLTNHPSLNNLDMHGNIRERGYTGGGRYPSAGSVRPSPSQPSPTHGTGFYQSNYPAPPSSTFRPTAASPELSTSAVGPRSGSGVNVAAIPFHPSYPATSPTTSTANSSGTPTLGAAPTTTPTQAPGPGGVSTSSSSAAPSTTGSAPGSSAVSASASASGDHTTLMPPQLQHRIYLSNVRPRPTPNFNPPPSVLAGRQSPTTLSSPSFPPLPSALGGDAGERSPSPAPSFAQSGPSLASIVTRAVLSPTALVERGMSSPGPGSPGHVSGGQGGNGEDKPSSRPGSGIFSYVGAPHSPAGSTGHHGRPGMPDRSASGSGSGVGSSSGIRPHSPMPPGPAVPSPTYGAPSGPWNIGQTTPPLKRN